MTLIRNPLLSAQALLIALVPLTFVASAVLVSVAPFNGGWVNNISGAVALMGSALALCRVWSSGTNQRVGLFWLVATIGFSVLAVSQWYEARIEATEHALRIEDLDDVLLLFIMLPIALIGVRTKGVWRIVKVLLLFGFFIHALSTGMDILEDWRESPVPAGLQVSEIAVDYSELVFLQLYLTAFGLFAASETFGSGLTGGAK